MKFTLMLIVFLISCNDIKAANVKMMQNASLILMSSSSNTINASSCDECICNMLQNTTNSSIVSLNCYIQPIDQVICQLFTIEDYETSSSFYQIKVNLSSTLYFLQLPSNNQASMTTSETIITSEITTSTSSSTTTTIQLIDPCFNQRFWDASGTIVAGTGLAGSDLNQLNRPNGIYLDTSDNLYISDSLNYRVMKYLYGASSGTIIAGETGVSGAALNQFGRTCYLYVDSNKTLYTSDQNNHRIMRWANGTFTGTIVAGTGVSGSSLNQLNSPEGIWIDSNSNVFIAEFRNHRVTKWFLGASSGVVVAGVTGSPGNTTDKLNYPTGLFYDETNEDLYISNYNAHTVMKWHIGNSSGTVIAGVSGTQGTNANLLAYPEGITLDQWKNLYVADGTNNRVQLFCYGSTTGITMVGFGTGGSNLSRPVDVKLDSQMNLYVSEYNQHRITKFNKL